MQVAGDDDAAVDATVHAERRAGQRLQIWPHRIHGSVKLQRGTHCPLGVVFVRDRIAEHDEHRVTHQLVHSATEPHGDRLCSRVDASHHLADDLGIQMLGHGRVPGGIREQHSDLATLLTVRCRDDRCWISRPR